jgi:energy-coupling factor transporter transmembrane protein EcfT
LIGLLVLAITLLIASHIGIYLGCFLLLGALLPLSHTPFGVLMSAVRKYLVLIVMSFLLPLFFSSGAHLLANLGPIKITAEGLCLGSLLGTRILLLVMVSALLMRTTAPVELIGALGRLLRPLRLIGVSPQRMATLLSLAWTALPQLWRTTRSTMAAADLKKTKNLQEMLPRLSGMVATLYVNAEPADHMWQHALRMTKQDPKNGDCHHPELRTRV